MSLENDILELKNQNIGYKKIGKMLNVAPLVVSKVLIDNGFTEHIDVPIEKQNLIIELFNDNKTYREIISAIGTTKQTITNVLLLNGIELRKSCYHKNSDEKVNHNYFKVIDSEEKAYWLGFLYADGYVDEVRCQIELTLAEKDKDHIDKFKNALDSSYKISTRTTKGFVSYRTILYSKQLVEDLQKLGCYRNKSLTLKPPTLEQVPSEFIKDFIRGYIDGDGCFSSNKVFCVVGTKEMLDWIIEHIRNNTDISMAGNFQPTGNALQWYHNGYKDFKLIHQYFYKDSSVYLTRKYNKCRLEPNLQKTQDD